MDVSRGGWAFVSAKFIAGGIGTFWIEGNGQKPKGKIETCGFWGLGGLGGVWSPISPFKGAALGFVGPLVLQQ